MKSIPFIVPLCGRAYSYGTWFAVAAMLLCGCAPSTVYHTHARVGVLPHLQRLLNIELSWPSPPNVHALKGAVLIRDGGLVDAPELAIARAILRTNPRL